MKQSWNVSIITSIICRLLGLIVVLAFVFGMVALTGNLHCLWLLFLLLAIEVIPVYEFTRKNINDNEVNKTND